MKQIPLHANNGHKPVVLIVDDNASIRNMVSWALELDGFEPAEAMDGKAALEWLRASAREGRIPSAILLDLAMPGMDGPAFLQAVRDLWRAYFPPVIVITANAEVADARTLGVAHVIVKPFHVRDLLDIVRKLL